ncbi:hypothetical protein MRB53_016656 [Persea americana]|uniref:Uncharacterized protein n=1 Tax=Persea americana TaxID=3435 RepID=A0ACC2M465_PERAE|nr:hypothetical protein MRB53_016656 [Persea americana]
MIMSPMDVEDSALQLRLRSGPPHNSHPHLSFQARGLIRRPSLLKPPRSNHPHMSFMACGRQGHPSPSTSQHSRSNHSHVRLVTRLKFCSPIVHVSGNDGSILEDEDNDLIEYEGLEMATSDDGTLTHI